MLQCLSPEGAFFHELNAINSPILGTGEMDVKGWTEGWMDGQLDRGRERQAGTEAWQTRLMRENSTSIEIPSFLPGGLLWATGESQTKSEELE